MGNLFNPENSFFTMLGKAFDLVVLSVVWLIFCIPIFTIGAATTAFYYAMVKVIRRDRGYLFQEFWRSFKMNFKAGTIIWIIIGVFATLMYFNIQFAFSMEGTKSIVLSILYYSMSLIVLCITIYVFPVLSRFTLTKLGTIKTAFAMSIKHLPSTLLMVVIVLISAFGLFLLPQFFFIIPGICCILCSLLMERILKKYTPTEEDGESRDEWYLE